MIERVYFQTSSGYWHIPMLRVEGELNVHEAKTLYFGRTAPWLCAGPTIDDRLRIKINRDGNL